MKPTGGLDNLDWALAAMERATSAISTSANEIDLCQTCCEAITASSPYALAWIGFAEHDQNRSVRVTAKSGTAILYLNGIHITWADEPNGNGSTGMAIKTGQMQLVNDISAYPDFQPWQERARRHGLRAVVTLPIKNGTATIASLSVYADHTDAFDATTARLLTNLAAMIGFGVQTHRTQASLAAALQQADKLRSLQLLEALTEASTDAIFVKDCEGRFLMCNQELTCELGAPKEAILGRTVAAFFPPAQAALLAARDASVLAQAQPVCYEESLTTSTGLRTFLTTKGKLYDSEGRVMGLYGVSRDITARKLIEQNQLELIALNQSVLDKSTMGIAVFQDDGKCVMINDALAQILGASKEVLLKINFNDLASWKSSGILKLAREAFESGKTGRGNIHAVSTFGRELNLDITVTPLMIWGTPHILTQHHDITDRVDSERALIASMRKLEQKEQEKTRFLAAASHDLRQPVAAAKLYLSTLKLTATSPQQDDLLERLDLSMNTFSNLLNTLLNISKLDAGLVQAIPATVNLAELFSWLEQNFVPMAVDKELRFDLFLPEKKPLAIRTDHWLIQSVLMNIVSNAIKFTPKGGILVSARRRGNDALLQVWDTGIGIAGEHIDRIFDEFYQVENPHRNRAEGLGLGLSIAKRTIQLLDSDLTCRSRLGQGTVFTLRLPIDKNSSAATELDPTVKTPPARQENASFALGKRFVIVEDDQLIAHGLISWLEMIGGEVLHFDNAEDALISPIIEQADYYITDYMLTGQLNGIQFLDCLKERSSQPVHAVLLTGDTSTTFIKKAWGCPWPILHKPIGTGQLAAALTTQYCPIRNSARPSVEPHQPAC